MSKKLNKAISSLFKKKEDTSSNTKQNLDEIFENSVTTSLLSNSEEWKLDHFEKHETLGTGTFGRVIKARHIETGQYFAIKTLKKNKVIQLKQVQHVMDEKTLQMEIKCPFTVQVYKTFQDEFKLYLVMDFIPGGELFTWLRKNKRFSNAVCRFFIAEILLGLEFIHRFEINFDSTF
jgi:protein kinase A